MNVRAGPKKHTLERTIVPRTVIFPKQLANKKITRNLFCSWRSTLWVRVSNITSGRSGCLQLLVFTFSRNSDFKDFSNRRDTFTSEERTSQSWTDWNEQKLKTCCFCVKSISYIGFDRRLCLPSYNWEEEEMVKLFPKDAWTQRYLLISWISEVNTSEQTRSAISILGKSHQLWYAR